MRKIRTSNNYCEFIEADDNGKILSARGFQFGELYFQIKNNKVTFYLNDQENPWRNDVWTINIPFELDGVQYDTEDAASAALHNIMNDRFQEQLDELREGLAAEEARAQEAEEQLDDKIEEETSRAISAETHLQDEVTELSGTVATFDERITRNTNDISALTNTVNAEIARSTGKDGEHDAAISGLTNSLNNEINRATSAETVLHNEITAEETRALAAESGLSDSLNDEITRATTRENAIDDKVDAEITRSTAKDAAHDTSISGLNTSLQNEITRATGAENSLRSDLNSEIQNRISGDTNLNNSINTEVSRATSVENQLRTDVTALQTSKADKVSAVASAIYNSTNKTIDFKNISGTVISSVDARDFIKDGMVDTVSIVNNNLVITFNTDAGKEDIVISLASIFDPTNYYNKSDIDNIVSGLTDDINEKADATDLTSLSGDVQTISGDVITISGDIATLSGDVQTINNNITTISGDVNTISGDVITLSGEIATVSGDAISSGEVQTMIDSSISGKADVTDIYTYVSGDRVSVKTASGTRKKSVNLEVPVYSGSGDYSVSMNNPSCGGNGCSNISGTTSFGAGYMVSTKNVDEAAFGYFNQVSSTNALSFDHSSGNTLFTIGNGHASNDGGRKQHNAFEVRQNGDIYIADTNDTTQTDAWNKPMIKLQDALGGGSTYTAGRGIDITNDTISFTLPISADSNSFSIIQGNFTSASGNSAHAEGLTTKANGNNSHAEGFWTESNGNYSHAEGKYAKSSGESSHAEGYYTESNGVYSHSEGQSTRANGEGSHAEGQWTEANGNYSHAEGFHTNTINFAEHANGQYNISSSGSSTFGDSGNTLFTVGNGSIDTEQYLHEHNALEIRENGDIYIADTNSSGEFYEKPMIKLQDALGGGSGSGVTSGEVQTMIDNSISGKQDTLSAGTNISITNNVISATDTTYTAGDGISITNNVISTTTQFACVSEAQWATISGNPQSNTVYMIY